jgi:hypothetical protein
MIHQDFRVVGIDADGGLICEDADGARYNCGETLEEFGVSNLTPAEIAALGGSR